MTGSVCRKIALETQGAALVAFACEAGDKDGVLLKWLERMGAPTTIRTIGEPEFEPDAAQIDEDAERAAVMAALEIARKHMVLPARMSHRVVD